MWVVHILAGQRDYHSQSGLQLWSTPDDGHSRGSPVEGLRLTLRNTRPRRAMEQLSNPPAPAGCLPSRGTRKGGDSGPQRRLEGEGQRRTLCEMERSATVRRDGGTGTIPRGGQVALRWPQNKGKKGKEKKKVLLYGNLSVLALKVLILKVGSQHQGCKVKVAEE